MSVGFPLNLVRLSDAWLFLMELLPTDSFRGKCDLCFTEKWMFVPFTPFLLLIVLLIVDLVKK